MTHDGQGNDGESLLRPFRFYTTELYEHFFRLFELL